MKITVLRLGLSVSDGSGFEFPISGFVIAVWGLGFEVWGLGFGVWGFDLGVVGSLPKSLGGGGEAMQYRTNPFV